MILTITLDQQNFTFDTSKPIDLSISISREHNPNAYSANPVVLEPVKQGDFIGSISQGSSVNYYTLQITPHGNGTHTECIGHILDQGYTIHECLQEFMFLAEVLTVEPIQKGDDWVITKEMIQKNTSNQIKALVIKILPNHSDKKTKNYSNTNPPYFMPEAIEYINALGIEHLLTDLPSVDPEKDHGKLLAHKAFWFKNNIPQTHKTITEMIYVDNEVKDGLYILQLGIISLESDASPSKPILYPLI